MTPTRGARDAAQHLIQSAFDAFTSRNVEAFLNLTSPAVEVLVPTAVVAHGGKPYVGPEGIRRWFADVASVWQELRLVPQRYAERDVVIVIIGRVYARDATGVTDLPAAWVITLEQELIVSLRVFNDRRQALAIAGLQDGDFQPL